MVAFATAGVSLVALLLSFFAGRQLGRGDCVQLRVTAKEMRAKNKALQRQLEAAYAAVAEVQGKAPQRLAEELGQALRKVQKRATLY